MLENGDRNLTEENYQEFINGINAAYQAKKNGTLKPKLQNVMKTEKPKTTQKKKSELKRI